MESTTGTVSTTTYEEEYKQDDIIYKISVSCTNFIANFSIRELSDNSSTILYESSYPFTKLTQDYPYFLKYSNEEGYFNFFRSRIILKKIKIEKAENNNTSIKFLYDHETIPKKECEVNIILNPKKILEKNLSESSIRTRNSINIFKISTLEEEKKKNVKEIERLTKENSYLKNRLEKLESLNKILKTKLKELEEKTTVDTEKQTSEIKYLKMRIQEMENRKRGDQRTSDLSSEKRNLISNFINKNQNFTYDIITPDETKILSDWIKTKNKDELIKVVLCFKATRDGDDTNTFFDLCEDRSPLILLVKTKKKKRFGAYISVPIKYPEKDERGYICDNEHFLFSLDLQKKYNCIKHDYAIRVNENFVLNFGYGSELGINKNFFTKNGYEYDYKDTYKMKGLELSTEKWFAIAELEVYQVISK